MSSIPLSLSKKKKKRGNLQILHITFCKLFKKNISKIEIVSQTSLFFIFSILKIVFKSGSQTHIM